MPEEEKTPDNDAQETEAAPQSPLTEGETAKPKKVVPKIPKGKFKKPEKTDLGAVKGKFKKPEKTDLSAAKGKFFKPKEGPVEKLALDRFAKKSKMDPKILYGIVGVVVVLVIVFVLFSMSSSKKTHAAYLKARNTIKDNRDTKSLLGIPPLDDGGNPSLTFGELKGYQIVDIENTVAGSKAKGSFKARAIYHKNQWKLLRLEVTVEGSSPKVLLDKEVTDKGLMDR